MSERHSITRRRIVAPQHSGKIQRHAFVYAADEGSSLAAAVYRPAHSERALPVIVIVTGYPDPGYEARMGCAQPETAQYDSWAEHLAASGFAVVAYRNRVPADAIPLLRHLRENALELGIDPASIGLWACSGSGPIALDLLLDPAQPVHCAALNYAYLQDLDGADAVASSARTFGFAHSAAPRSIADWPTQRPLLLVRAGADAMPGLNRTIDRFVATALAKDRPVSLVNVPGAPHAFDITQDGRESRAAIAAVVAFFTVHLSP
jgi:acetyl esterase/lipase